MPRPKTVVDLREVLAHFEVLEDPRSTINLLHPLPSVVTISLMAVFARANGPTGIHKWAVAKEDLLLKSLNLPHGLPSKDVIRRVLCALKVEAFQACFGNWLKSLSDVAEQNLAGSESSGKHMAVDGKTMKGSHDRANGIGPMHLVSVLLSNFGLTLAQVATDQKSNEILKCCGLWISMVPSSRENDKRPNRERDYLLTLQDTDRFFEVCRDAEWKRLVSLWRNATC